MKATWINKENSCIPVCLFASFLPAVHNNSCFRHPSGSWCVDVEQAIWKQHSESTTIAESGMSGFIMCLSAYTYTFMLSLNVYF